MRFLPVRETHGIELNPRLWDDDDTTALHWVASGMAVCLSTTELLRTTPNLNGRVAIWPHFRHELPLSLCYLKSRAEDPVLRELVRVVRTLWPR